MDGCNIRALGCSMATVKLVVHIRALGCYIRQNVTSALNTVVTCPNSTTNQNPLQVPSDGSFTLNFTLYEAAAPGSVVAIFFNFSLLNLSYEHAFTLTFPSVDASQSYEIHVADVSAFGLDGPIPPGMYKVQVGYMDVYENPMVVSNSFRVYILSPPPLVPLLPTSPTATDGPTAWNALPYWAWIIILVGGTLVVTLTATLVAMFCISKRRVYNAL